MVYALALNEPADAQNYALSLQLVSRDQIAAGARRPKQLCVDTVCYHMDSLGRHPRSFDHCSCSEVAYRHDRVGHSQPLKFHALSKPRTHRCDFFTMNVNYSFQRK